MSKVHNMRKRLDYIKKYKSRYRASGVLGLQNMRDSISKFKKYSPEKKKKYKDTFLEYLEQLSDIVEHAHDIFTEEKTIELALSDLNEKYDKIDKNSTMLPPSGNFKILYNYDVKDELCIPPEYYSVLLNENEELFPDLESDKIINK